MAGDLVYQIANNVELSLFSFGNESVLTDNLGLPQQSVRTHTIMIRAAQLRLSSFAAEFAYAINTQTFCWLEIFLDASDCSQVENTLVNFNTLFCSVLISNFLQPLQDLISWISEKCSHTKLTNDVEGGGKKKHKKQENCLVDNPQIGPDWKLCPSEK